MLRLSQLTLARGAKTLLKDAALTVFAGHKVGLVGENGCGKSSLFALLLGKLLPEQGEIDLPRSWVIAHVAQETPAVDDSALTYVLQGDRELIALQAALDQAERDPTTHGEHVAELHTRYHDIGGYSAHARAAALLHGLGFAYSQHEQPVQHFSGGWRMRLNLAQALMCRSDLLLLDEPTNHLDLDAVLWLEEWLKQYAGTLLLITHDRDFLDATVNTIAHFDRQQLIAYKGHYSAFEIARTEQLAVQQANYDKQQRQIAHWQTFVDRFRAKATKAKQAQSRLKALERMQRIAAAHVDSPFSFEFAAPGSIPKQLVKFEHAAIGYPNKLILKEINWSILSGDRIGLLGANGAGKSTLLKALAGHLPLVQGERHVSRELKIGYFAQHQLEQLRVEHTPLWHLQQLSPSVREQVLRDFLGGFAFSGDRALATVGEFSGGEKARLTLALLVWQRPNLLLLDEPTNHLDIELRQALTTALQQYGGALIVVAHDRHLLRATTDQLWLVNDGELKLFEGDLDDYREWVVKRKLADSESVERPKPNRKSERRSEAEERQRIAQQRKPLLRELADIEGQLEALTNERQPLEAWLASPQAYQLDNKIRLPESIKRQGEIAQMIAELEARWIELQDKLVWLR